MRAGIAGSLADHPWATVRSDRVVIRVRAKPGSSRCGIARVDRDTVVITLKSRPEQGRANQELIEFLSELAGVSRSSVSIAHGAASRVKVVHISTRDPAAISQALTSAIEIQVCRH